MKKILLFTILIITLNIGIVIAESNSEIILEGKKDEVLENEIVESVSDYYKLYPFLDDDNKIKETDFVATFYFWKKNEKGNYEEYKPDSIKFYNEIYGKNKLVNGEMKKAEAVNLIRTFESDYKIEYPILGEIRKGLGSPTTKGLESFEKPEKAMYDLSYYVLKSNTFGYETVADRKHSFYYKGIEDDTLSHIKEGEYYHTKSKLLGEDARKKDIIHFQNFTKPIIDEIYYSPVFISWKQNEIHMIIDEKTLNIEISDVAPKIEINKKVVEIEEVVKEENQSLLFFLLVLIVLLIIFLIWKRNNKK